MLEALPEEERKMVLSHDGIHLSCTWRKRTGLAFDVDPTLLTGESYSRALRDITPRQVSNIVAKILRLRRERRPDLGKLYAHRMVLRVT